MIIHRLISKESIIEGAELSLIVKNRTNDEEEKEIDEPAPIIDPKNLSEMDRELEETVSRTGNGGSGSGNGRRWTKAMDRRWLRRWDGDGQMAMDRWW